MSILILVSIHNSCTSLIWWQTNLVAYDLARTFQLYASLQFFHYASPCIEFIILNEMISTFLVKKKKIGYTNNCSEAFLYYKEVSHKLNFVHVLCCYQLMSSMAQMLILTMAISYIHSFIINNLIYKVSFINIC